MNDHLFEYADCKRGVSYSQFRKGWEFSALTGVE